MPLHPRVQDLAAGKREGEEERVDEKKKSAAHRQLACRRDGSTILRFVTVDGLGPNAGVGAKLSNLACLELLKGEARGGKVSWEKGA